MQDLSEPIIYTFSFYMLSQFNLTCGVFCFTKTFYQLFLCNLTPKPPLAFQNIFHGSNGWELEYRFRQSIFIGTKNEARYFCLEENLKVKFVKCSNSLYVKMLFLKFSLCQGEGTLHCTAGEVESVEDQNFSSSMFEFIFLISLSAYQFCLKKLLWS